jgi:hypothetical protein
MTRSESDTLQRGPPGTKPITPRQRNYVQASDGGVRVAPSTFRFPGLAITVRRIALTSGICIAALIRMLMNGDERRRMERR